MLNFSEAPLNGGRGQVCPVHIKILASSQIRPLFAQHCSVCNAAVINATSLRLASLTRPESEAGGVGGLGEGISRRSKGRYVEYVGVQ